MTHTQVTTQHTVTYKGYTITIKGQHSSEFARNSKMGFWFSCGDVNLGGWNNRSLKDRLDKLVQTIQEREAYKAFEAQYKGLSNAQKISHPNFAYSRFQTSSYGNYYNLYWRSSFSPTGVELVGGCDVDEWEAISKEAGKSNSYYSPTENRMSAR